MQHNNYGPDVPLEGEGDHPAANGENSNHYHELFEPVGTPDAAPGEEGENAERGAQDPDNLIHYGYGARNNGVRSADDGFNYYAAQRYGGMIGMYVCVYVCVCVCVCE